MTDKITRAELRKLLAEATPGEWVYRPFEYDDWGTIRVAGVQSLVATSRFGIDPPDYSDCRERKIDPYEPNGRAIAAAHNALPGLLDALDAAEAAEKHDAEKISALESFRSGAKVIADELSAKLKAAEAEINRLHAGGCARDQRTTQHCAEALALREKLDAAEIENERLREALEQIAKRRKVDELIVKHGTHPMWIQGAMETLEWAGRIASEALVAPQGEPKAERTKINTSPAPQQKSGEPLQASGDAGKTTAPTDELVGGRNREPLEAERDSSSQSRLGGA